MESKSTEISISERKIIEKMWKDGKSRRDIARSVRRQYSSIQRVIDNFKSTGIYASKPRPSKPIIRERRSRKLVWRHSASKRAFSTNGDARRQWSYGVGVHGEQWCWQVEEYRINYE
ncbi:hypothetical protein TNCV_546921 [Trichonephila clavipes]|nr:hypothetical protein TNCV_546921 [Trichonephila clavipes]